MTRWRWLVLFALLGALAVVYTTSASCTGPLISCQFEVNDNGNADVVGGLLGTLGDVVGTLVGALFAALGEVVNALAELVDGIVDLLPDAPDLGLELGGFVYGFGIMDSFLPLHEALAYAVVLFGAANAGLVFRTAVTIYHLIPKPGVGT